MMMSSTGAVAIDDDDVYVDDDQVRLGFDDTRSLMRELDRDGDGSIDYREFASFLKGGSGRGDAASSSSSSASGAGADRPSRGNKGVDDEPVGGKGVGRGKASTLTISDRVASELRDKFDAAIDAGKIKGYEEVFKAMDKDGNGRVSRREFEDGLRELRVRRVGVHGGWGVAGVLYVTSDSVGRGLSCRTFSCAAVIVIVIVAEWCVCMC